MLDADTLRSLLPPNTRLLSYELDPSTPDDGASNVRWHQIAIEGEWSGHWQGTFSLSDRDFEQMIANADASAVDIPADYEHRSAFAMFGGDSRASGWIDQLQIRDSEQGKALFARVSWTERAAESIRAREYRYVSPSIQWKTPDRKTGVDTGVSLQSLALTNTPFLEELPPVTLNSAGFLGALAHRKGATDMNAEQIAKLAAAVNLSADVPTDDVIAAIEAIKAQADGLGSIRDALKLSADAGSEAIVAGITAMRGELAAAPSAEALATLTAQVNGIQAEAALANARGEGKIVASNETWAAELATKDLASFSAWAQAAPAVVPVDRKVPVGGAPAATGEPTEDQIKAQAAQLTAHDLNVATQLGLSPEQYAKHNMDRLGN